MNGQGDSDRIEKGSEYRHGQSNLNGLIGTPSREQVAANLHRSLREELTLQDNSPHACANIQTSS